MAAHRQVIIFRICGSYLLYFLAYSHRSQIGRLPYFHTWCGLMRIQNAGLKCAARGSLKIQDVKIRQNSPYGHHRTIFSGYIFATKAYIDSRKKNSAKQQYLLHMSSQYGELWSTDGWDQLASLGHHIRFQRVSRLGFVVPTSLNLGQPNFARWLAVFWAGTLYIHFRGLLPPNGILPGAEFALHPSLAFSYIGSVTARHSTWLKQWSSSKLCGVGQGRDLRNFRS